MNPVWDILWKLKVLAKIIFFGWKTLHGMVPSIRILANHHVKVSPQCQIYKLGVKDNRHLMFTCRRAKQVWRRLGLEEIVDHALSLDRSGSIVFEELL
jgi:hypothetical protein